MLSEVTVKIGSKWIGSEYNIFVVLHVIELDGHTWIHYRKETECEDAVQEYSCYIESFLARFTPYVNQ